MRFSFLRLKVKKPKREYCLLRSGIAILPHNPGDHQAEPAKTCKAHLTIGLANDY